MKKNIIYLITWALLSGVPAFAQLWKPINNGISSCKSIRAVEQVNTNLAIAVGGTSGVDGFIMRSENGGITWEEIASPAGNWLNDVYFLDDLTGVAAGKGIYRTEDGGLSWQTTVSTGYFYDIDFANATHGYLTTGTQDIYRTTDGGQSWSAIPIGFPAIISAVEATSSQELFLAMRLSGPAGNTGAVIRSSDGAQSWTNSTTFSHPLTSLHFPTPETGFGVGNFGIFISTFDGGQTWQESFLDPDLHLNSVWFADEQQGYITSNNGIIFRTENGGQDWEQVNTGQNGTLLDVHSVDGQSVVLAGTNGILATSSDSGLNWHTAQTGNMTICETLRGVFAIDEDRVVVCGNNGAAYWSDNGGEVWQRASVPLISTFYAVHFTGPAKGHMATVTGILRSGDGGQSWHTTSVPPAAGLVLDVQFPPKDATVGYACGGGGSVLKTINSGGNWTSLDSFTNRCLLGIHFIDAEEGWVAGDAGLIAHTTDGGQTWSQEILTDTFGLSHSLNALFFTDPAIGFIAGDRHCWRTRNGGQTWEIMPLPNGFYNGIHFTDKDNGWVTGSAGIIYRTFDGGDTWINEQNLSVSRQLVDVHFANAYTGFIAGDKIALKTDRSLEFCLDTLSGASGTFVDVPVRVANFNRIANFQLSIRSSDPQTVQIIDTSQVALGGQFIRQINQHRINLLWIGDDDCNESINDQEAIFSVRVKLTGVPGTCASLYIDDAVFPLAVYQCAGNVNLPLVPLHKPGLVCLAAAAELCGNVQTLTGEGKAGVTVNVQSLPATGTQPTGDTGPDGDYCIPDLVPGSDIVAAPVHDVLWGKNITSNDYWNLHGYLNGTDDLQAGWQKVAADVNADGWIDEDDLDALFDLISAPQSPIPDNTSWRFVANYAWPLPLSQDQTVPSFPEFLAHDDIAGDLANQDFTGIKVGDLDGDAALIPGPGVDVREHDPFVLNVDRALLPDGGFYEFSFRSPHYFNITSWQAELNFDPAAMQFVGLLPGDDPAIPLPRFRQTGEGKVVLLWLERTGNYNGAQAEQETVLFRIRFEAIHKSTKLPALWLDDASTSALAFQNQYPGRRIVLTGQDEIPGKARLFHPAPNPARHQTTLTYDVGGGNGHVQLLITDEFGRKVDIRPLEQGIQRSFVLETGAYTPGFYFLSLLVDGRILDRQKLVVTR